MNWNSREFTKHNVNCNYRENYNQEENSVVPQLIYENKWVLVHIVLIQMQPLAKVSLKLP